MNGRLRWIVFAAFIVIIGGCAAPEVKVDEGHVFYPPPPALPRLQFLASFTGAKDIEGEKTGFESFVTGEKESGRRLDKPYGVAIYAGKIYVCDTNATVMVFDLEKKTFEPLQGAKGLGKLIQPLNIHIDRDGNKYVTDAIRQQVVVFDKNDFYVTALGKPGDWKPVDAVSYEGLVYVADIVNSEIKVFDKNTGSMVRSFGSKGDRNETLHLPTNLAFDNKGFLYVVDTGRIQVVKYDRDGHFIESIGSVGTNLGHFARPKGIAIDREDRMYVVDASFYNVQIFNDKAQLLLFFGEGGTKPGKLILPAQVVVDYENTKYFEKYISPNFQVEHLVIVTCQFGDRMVNVFAFGKEKGKKYPTEQEILKETQEYIDQKQKEAPRQEEGETKEQK